MSSLSKLPPAIRRPLLGIFVLGCVAATLVFAGVVTWLLSFPVIWIFQHLTWKIVGITVAIPVIYGVLAAIGVCFEE